jgi:hypothetical protein
LSRRLAALVVLLGIAGGVASACSKDHGSQEKFCAALPATPDLSALLQDLGSTDPAKLEDRLSEGADQFHRLAKSAPDEIRSDVDRVTETVDEILDMVRGHLDDPGGLRAELASRKSHLLAVGPAAQRVVDYAADTCGIDLGSTTTSATATTTTTTP